MTVGQQQLYGTHSAGEFQVAPTVTSMCPAVAMGVESAQSGRLNERVAVTIRSVSDLMAEFAREERDAQLEEWDRLIERAKGSRGAEREA